MDDHLHFTDLLKFKGTMDLVATSFPELQLLYLYREVEPYKLREGVADSKSFNKSSMLTIWDRYHSQSARPLFEMKLHLETLAQPWRYNQIYRLWRIPTRTYFVIRCTNEGLDGSSIIRKAMLEYEQTTRETLEKAPQQPKEDFPNLCRGLERLCNKAQPLNTGVAGVCGR
jgi:hypothetical protein